MKKQGFDYSTVDKADRVYLKDKERIIKQRNLDATLESGRDLKEANERVGDETYQKWREACIPCGNCFAATLTRYIHDDQIRLVCELDELRAKAAFFLAATSSAALQDDGGTYTSGDVRNLFKTNMKLFVELKKRMHAEMRKPPMTAEEREETDAYEELEDEIVYDLEKWIDIFEDIKTAITGGRLSRQADLPNPAKTLHR
jgi:hypothetical protein